VSEENDTVPQTTDAATAPSSPQGQADGSPPAEGDSTSGGNGDVEQLRRALTQKGEELSKARRGSEILERAMQTPEWEAVQARLLGKPVTPEEDPDILMFGDNPDDLAKGKKWKAALYDQFRREFAPVVQEVRGSKVERVLADTLREAGVSRQEQETEDFQKFRAEFEDENTGFRRHLSNDPESASKWMSSEYERRKMRASRTPVGDRQNASLERGGGSASRIGGAASQVTVRHDDPDKHIRLFEAYERGMTPVDENGKEYKRKGK
jgi:hypothetical protein